jgi:hypothetical protein
MDSTQSMSIRAVDVPCALLIAGEFDGQDEGEHHELDHQRDDLAGKKWILNAPGRFVHSSRPPGRGQTPPWRS